MAIGERIHFFRTLRGMTQKYLGMALDFPEKSADVRLAQYENGSRTPKADVTAALAQVLDVSPKALDVPDIDSYTGLMHTLFTMLTAWGEVAAKLKAGEITQEEYDRWRYRYPEFDTTQRWAKVPSQELSDMLVDEFIKNKE